MDRHVLFEIKMLHNAIVRDTLGKINKERGVFPSLIQVEMMVYLLNNEKRKVYQKDLEQVFKLRRSTISGVLQTMEKNGMIKRIDSANDARVKRIVLTAKAKTLHEKGVNMFRKLESKVVQGIDQEKLDVFLDVLEQMKKNME